MVLSEPNDSYYGLEDEPAALALFEEYGLTGILETTHYAKELIDEVINHMNAPEAGPEQREYWRMFGEKLLAILYTSQAQVEEAYTQGYAEAKRQEEARMMRDLLEAAAAIENGEFWQDDN